MFLLRMVLLTGLGAHFVSPAITQFDTRASSETILGGILRSKGKIKNVINQELANTVDNIANKGKNMMDEFKNKLNIFGRPSEEKPDPSVVQPLSGIKKWINDRLAGDKKPIFDIFSLGNPNKDTTSSTKIPGTTKASTTIKPTTTKTSTESGTSRITKISTRMKPKTTTKSRITSTTAVTTLLTSTPTTTLMSTP